MRRDDERGGGWVIAQFALLALILLVPRRGPAWPRALTWPTRALGLAALAGGAWLLARATRDLGANLTPFPRPKLDAELVRDGVYGVVRHPIYGALALLAGGWALLTTNPPRLVLAAALFALFDAKAAREETWLLAQFPDYAAYRAAVPKLFPRLW